MSDKNPATRLADTLTKWKDGSRASVHQQRGGEPMNAMLATAVAASQLQEVLGEAAAYKQRTQWDPLPLVTRRELLDAVFRPEVAWGHSASAQNSISERALHELTSFARFLDQDNAPSPLIAIQTAPALQAADDVAALISSLKDDQEISAALRDRLLPKLVKIEQHLRSAAGIGAITETDMAEIADTATSVAGTLALAAEAEESPERADVLRTWFTNLSMIFFRGTGWVLSQLAIGAAQGTGANMLTG